MGSTIAADVAEQQDRVEPPGTILLEAKQGDTQQLVLNPIPTSDPNDPLNWSTLRKSINFGLACTFVLFTFVQMCNIYVAYGPYALDLGITYNDYNSAIASSYAGLTVGCLFFMPFVHRYGRRPVYLVSSAIQFATTVWAAKMNSKGELIATNFLAAIGGAVSEAIVLITIADLFFVHQRARMNGIYGMMQSIGSFLGPVSMGYVVKSLGWRFMWWLTTIFVGVNFVAVIFLFEESKYVAHNVGQPINQQETGAGLGTVESRSSIDKAPGNNLSSVDESAPPSYVKKTYRQRMALFTPTSEPFIQHFYQPFVIFFTIPAIAYTAITYGMLLAFMATTTSCLSYFTLLPPYNFSPDKVGLLSLGPFVGLLLSTVVIAPLSDWSVVWLAKRNKGVYEPEMRLWLAIPGSLIAFAGLITFGFCLSQGKPVMVLVVAYAIYCVGFTACAGVSLTYTFDAYQDILGDSMVAVVFLRNALSVVIMFSFTPWITNMGIRNAYILIFILAIVVLNVPILLLKWGKALRRKTAPRYRRFAQMQVSHRQV